MIDKKVIINNYYHFAFFFSAMIRIHFHNQLGRPSAIAAGFGPAKQLYRFAKRAARLPYWNSLPYHPLLANPEGETLNGHCLHTDSRPDTIAIHNLSVFLNMSKANLFSIIGFAGSFSKTSFRFGKRAFLHFLFSFNRICRFFFLKIFSFREKGLPLLSSYPF